MGLQRHWALSIQPKIPKISKQGHMVRKSPEKVSRKSGNCRISEKQTTQPKIPEIPGGKSNGTGFPVRDFRKFGYTKRGCPVLPEISENAVPNSPLEISRKANRKLWSNRKRPLKLIDSCFRIIDLCLLGNYIMPNFR